MWLVAVRPSYIQDARFLKVNAEEDLVFLKHMSFLVISKVENTDGSECM
jgi:hypothetical protein